MFYKIRIFVSKNLWHVDTVDFAIIIPTCQLIDILLQLSSICDIFVPNILHTPKICFYSDKKINETL